ncbi:chemotaxis protein CheX [Lysobacter sp. D1-1-M9]|uniref:chemotaxis protein CheX n=1 Tax=Novilysobacter longmucuonensis TaxID=3098603 RepID=UPI002FC9001D
MAAKFLGQFLLEKGSINRQQLLAALEAQHASNPLLGELAEQHGMLSAVQARRVNERQRAEDRRFGDIAQDMGLLGAEQVAELLDEQKARRKRFGEILVEQGTLTGEQLDAELAAHQLDRDQAVQALALGIAEHPLGDAVTSAINTCTRLFPRILGSQCQFSSLVNAGAPVTSCEVTAHVRISSERPLAIGIGCDQEVMTGIACAFLSITPDQCDPELAVDALGELVNVLMGYVVKDALPDDAGYRASPPDTGVPAAQFLAQGERTLAVTMTSPLGPFVLIVNS